MALRDFQISKRHLPFLTAKKIHILSNSLFRFTKAKQLSCEILFSSKRVFRKHITQVSGSWPWLDCRPGKGLCQRHIAELSGTALGVPLNKLGNPHLKPTTSQSQTRLT
jgi:hypothetical protein